MIDDRHRGHIWLVIVVLLACELALLAGTLGPAREVQLAGALTAAETSLNVA